jgi:hypothetical protein
VKALWFKFVVGGRSNVLGDERKVRPSKASSSDQYELELELQSFRVNGSSPLAVPEMVVVITGLRRLW